MLYGGNELGAEAGGLFLEVLATFGLAGRGDFEGGAPDGSIGELTLSGTKDCLRFGFCENV